MLIDIATKNHLVSMRHSPPRMFFITDRNLTRKQRVQRWLATLRPIKPTHRSCPSSASDRQHQMYLLRVTHSMDWLGFNLRVTIRYPITSERANEWASQSHLASNIALKHNI